ncbi:MAG: SUMF1/EgtB/PvdO family nonheme iron enzyme [Planctomycetes bacterium]|nr:SUMF1/EgtB/PvdO family nonheme iron enzyme [Planctomycetota bacterium]
MHESQDRIARAIRIFERVFTLPPADRAHRLDELCGDDTRLRAEVEALLEHHETPGPAILRTGEGPVARLGDDAMPDTIGRYRIHGVLGRGGMGTVFRAEQSEPIHRYVALKVVQGGAATEGVLARFALERRALAAMNHRCIAKVFDAGATDAGRPYFVMELVEGPPLTDFCDEHGLSIRERIRLFQEVCRGVQHAHQKGVIHRDLKPANVLVSREDRTAVPKILDFGIAKATSDDLADTAPQTAEQSIIGTPEYMSPEQASRDGGFVDVRTDVYSLGVMLYELLAGELPFSTERLRSKGPLGALEIIRDEEPPRPSTKLTTAARLAATAAGKRSTTITALARTLRGDLDWIVMKALSKDRERRYESADAFANDLQRYLDHEPVLAGPPTVRYRFGRFVRKYRGRLVAAMALFVTLAIGLVVSLHFWSAASALAIEKDEQYELAQRNLDRFYQAANLVVLDEAKATVDETYPATPENHDSIQHWLNQHADPLLASLPELQRTRDELRERALPWTPAEIAADREGHPDYRAWLAARHDLAARAAAMAVRRGQAEARNAVLDAATIALSAEGLVGFLRDRIDPRVRSVFGEEAEALAAARLLAERAQQDGPWALALSLRHVGWAAFQCGLDEEARSAARRAVEVAPAERTAMFRDNADELERSIDGADDRLAESQRDLAALEAKVSARRTWRFADKEDAFLNDVLTKLIDEVRTFDAVVVKQARDRLTWASMIGELTLSHPNAPATWGQAREAIRAADGVTASELYRSDPPLELEPQCGLIPIGMNPVTKLWEFYHLRSAWYPDIDTPARDYEIPRHEANGTIRIGNRTGIVFVLVPGGTFWMGAQKSDPSGPNYDPAADDDEAPVRVTLEPFFIARHELTQSQFERLSGEENPSNHRPGQRYEGNAGKITWAHPVEQVTWLAADALMTRSGLDLPTEAQWEYACRAGSTTCFITGDDPASLAGFANVADETALTVHASWQYIRGIRDGWVSPAPVGSYACNAFGLYDMQGNVSEWVRDPYSARYEHSPARSGDGYRAKPPSSHEAETRVFRGGNFRRGAFHARSANRSLSDLAFQTNLVGLRPSCAVRRRSP